MRGGASSEGNSVDKHCMFACVDVVIAHMSDTVVKTEPSPERPLPAQELMTAQPVGASDESPVDAQADAETANPGQLATIVESCAQVVGTAGQLSTVIELAHPVGASDESHVDAQTGAEVASLVQSASFAKSGAQAIGVAGQASTANLPVQLATTAESCAQAVGVTCCRSNFNDRYACVASGCFWRKLCMQRQAQKWQVLCSLHRLLRAVHRQLALHVWFLPQQRQGKRESSKLQTSFPRKERHFPQALRLRTWSKAAFTTPSRELGPRAKIAILVSRSRVISSTE